MTKLSSAAAVSWPPRWRLWPGMTVRSEGLGRAGHNRLRGPSAAPRRPGPDGEPPHPRQRPVWWRRAGRPGV